MYEPTQELIIAELRLRGMVSVAHIMSLLGPGFASLLPYELQRVKEMGLESVVRLP